MLPKARLAITVCLPLVKNNMLWWVFQRIVSELLKYTRCELYKQFSATLTRYRYLQYSAWFCVSLLRKYSLQCELLSTFRMFFFWVFVVYIRKKVRQDFLTEIATFHFVPPGSWADLCPWYAVTFVLLIWFILPNRSWMSCFTQHQSFGCVGYFSLSLL